MSVSGQGLINLLVYLVIIIIIIVILFWVLDHFLMVAPLIQYSDATSTGTFCNDITYPDQDSNPHGDVICKLV